MSGKKAEFSGPFDVVFADFDPLEKPFLKELPR
jgi:hypothetical protein